MNILNARLALFRSGLTQKSDIPVALSEMSNGLSTGSLPCIRYCDADGFPFWMTSDVLFPASILYVVLYVPYMSHIYPIYNPYISHINIRI